METNKLADLRREYSSRELSRSSVAGDPFAQFTVWMNEALNSQVVDANAMTVSTVDSDGRPSSRVVLLKEFGSDGFVFFTNYESKKGRDLAANPNIALHFFWADLERQVIIEGTSTKISREESEAYFATRPVESRIAAWASKQSSTLESREQLEQRMAEMRERFKGQDVVCPPHWGGYRVAPDRVEFWQGRASRLHDRIVYKRSGDDWTISRLSP
jgi:pyridoxamine 5'-phosphate oxidase